MTFRLQPNRILVASCLIAVCHVLRGLVHPDDVATTPELAAATILFYVGFLAGGAIAAQGSKKQAVLVASLTGLVNGVVGLFITIWISEGRDLSSEFMGSFRSYVLIWPLIGAIVAGLSGFMWSIARDRMGHRTGAASPAETPDVGRTDALLACILIVLLGHLPLGVYQVQSERKRPNFGGPHSHEAEILYQRGDWEPLVEKARLWVECEPTDAHALWCLARALYGTGQWQDAAEAYRKLGELEPGWRDQTKAYFDVCEAKIRAEQEQDSQPAAPADR